MPFDLGFTHRPLSSSFLGLPYRILNINHKKELLRGLWVGFWGALVFLPCHVDWAYSRSLNTPEP